MGSGWTRTRSGTTNPRQGRQLWPRRSEFVRTFFSIFLSASNVVSTFLDQCAVHKPSSCSEPRPSPTALCDTLCQHVYLNARDMRSTILRSFSVGNLCSKHRVMACFLGGLKYWTTPADKFFDGRM